MPAPRLTRHLSVLWLTRELGEVIVPKGYRPGCGAVSSCISTARVDADGPAGGDAGGKAISKRRGYLARGYSSRAWFTVAGSGLGVQVLACLPMTDVYFSFRSKGAEMEDRSLRFGVEAHNGIELNVWQGTLVSSSKFGIKFIVSADCDLLNSNGRDDLFCLSVLPAREYIGKFAIPDCAEEIMDLLLAEVRAIANAMSSPIGGVSNEPLREWLVRGGEVRWRADIKGIHKPDVAFINCLVQPVEVLARVVESGHVIAPDLIKLKSEDSQVAKRLEKLSAKIKKVLSNRMQGGRSDIYIIPTIPGVLESGFVVPFRTLTVASRRDICRSKMDLIDHPDAYVPVGVCRPMLTQSLLQKLMSYFSRIGVTNSFKEEQDEVVRILVGEIS